MTAPRLSIDDIKRAANAQPERLLAALGITAAFNRGGYISICNPVRKDRHPSLTIWFKNGFVAFTDHASGDKGDVLGLVAYLQQWEHLPKKGVGEACRFVSDLFGLERVSSDQLAADRARARRRAAELAKTAGEEQARKEGEAFALWLRGVPVGGTLADTYLREARGIDLDRLPKGPRGGDRAAGVLRFLPNHRHAESDAQWPCLIAGCVDFRGAAGAASSSAVRDAAPKIRAIHRTWLKPDGRGKAAVTPQRKVWPGFAGLVIPIWRGADNLTIDRAATLGIRETLVLTEGIEDGLTAALADPSHRVWAMIALGNMAHVPIPECVDGIIVHRQNDWQKPQAVAAFERGKAALEASGRPVVEVEALGGKDLNDTLRGEE